MSPAAGIPFCVRSNAVLSGPVGWLAIGCGNTIVVGATIGTAGVAVPVFEIISTTTTTATFPTHYSLSEAVSDTVKRTLTILQEENARNKGETLLDRIALLENTKRTIELVKAYKEFKELYEEKKDSKL